MSEIICHGCGVEIQTEDKKGLGYAPPSALNREEITCQRCFRLKHYNEVQDVSLTDDDFLKMLTQIGDSNALVVKVIDIFDFNGSFIPGLARFTGQNPIILVGNKVDLLPKSINPNKVKNWMRKAAKDLGLKVEDVFLVSAKKGIGMDEVATGIEKIRNNQDVYVVGCTNVGKSTFINYLIHETTGEKEAITTSYFPGTTLGFIDIPLDERTSMYDTPGVINRHQMAHYISEQDLKVITPKKEIKSRVYQLNEGQTLYFGGLARLDFEKGDRKSFVCYFSNELMIHRTKTEKADELYQNHIGELLEPPNADTLEELPTLKPQSFHIKEKTDIVFSGLGWVTVTEGGTTVTAYIPEGVRVSLREALI
ncbi:ribosome biogenesis GTPase YqeH [Salinibacillus xinjiangensis]|uniref:Ribosome biogenesis GTPase YqeH n=1 Tax=Salinibacillus xinjiangensis TaxID=1229268 RepID=A0A6G1X6U7_9BACI|nr:ribosome biogenesis GTPase YqeH [Salinibacillus xinjiangensis]MRG86667.1 ribosome biogenesis GTPase YqeH [Salinibacillus xinjiangensis]